MKVTAITLFGLVAFTVAAPMANVESVNDEIENAKRDNQVDNAYRRYMGGHWVGFSPENKKRDNQVDNAYRRYLGGHWVGFSPESKKRDNQVDNAYRRYLGGHWVGFSPESKKRDSEDGSNDEEGNKE